VDVRESLPQEMVEKDAQEDSSKKDMPKGSGEKLLSKKWKEDELEEKGESQKGGPVLGR